MDKACFCHCMVLGLSKLEKIPGQPFKKMKTNCQADLNRSLKETAIELQGSVGLNIHQDITFDHMELLAEKYEVQIHICDMHGVHPEFTSPLSKRNYTDDVPVVQNMAQFHFILNI